MSESSSLLFAPPITLICPPELKTRFMLHLANWAADADGQLDPGITLVTGRRYRADHGDRPDRLFAVITPAVFGRYGDPPFTAENGPIEGHRAPRAYFIDESDLILSANLRLGSRHCRPGLRSGLGRRGHKVIPAALGLDTEGNHRVRSPHPLAPHLVERPARDHPHRRPRRRTGPPAMMQGDLLADGYYAVPDPDGPDEPGGETLTLWRVSRSDIFRYPKTAIYGPVLPRQLAPTDPEERYRWFCAGTDYYQLWMSRVVDAMRQDPVAAQLRFSERTGRCCVCARVLTDRTSRRFGVGSACREGLPDGLLRAFIAMRAAESPGPGAP